MTVRGRRPRPPAARMICARTTTPESTGRCCGGHRKLGLVGAAVAVALAAEGWSVRGIDRVPGVLRIARCFPEPSPVLATHLLHRAVGLTDVAAAAARVADQDTTTGTFTIAGPYLFTRADCPALHHDAASVIAERLPDVAAAFRARHWPLPRTLDRVYDSSAAAAAFGYRPRYGVRQMLRTGGNGRESTPPE
jgi:nucleoside-diphosphate-sugar epimerase